MDEMSQDQIVMQDGRVMIVRNSKMSPVDEEITLPDGTKVKSDGMILMPDGTTRMMAEGETMLLPGEAAGPEGMTDRQFKETMEDEELRDELH